MTTKDTSKIGIPGMHLILLASLVSPLASASAADDAGRAGAYRSSVAQEQLRVQTKRTRLEITRMIEEFKRFGSAASEIALAEEALKKLEVIGDQQMTGVVQTLRDANRAEDDAEAKKKMLEASAAQKEIQSTLQLLADKLSILQAQAAMQGRVKGIMTRQIANARDTKGMVDGTTRDWEVKQAQALALTEQKAIEKEVQQIEETLSKIPKSQSIVAAKIASEQSKVEEHAKAAADAIAAKDFKKALEEQAQVAAGLDQMMTGLNSEKSNEEKAQEAVAKLNELSAQQNELARSTSKSAFSQQESVKNRQEEIANEVAALKNQVAQLNPEAGAKLGEAQATMDKIDEALKRNREHITNPENKLGVVNDQNSVADNLEDVAKALEPLTGQSSTAESSDPSDAAQDAINDAVEDALTAQERINLASSLMQRGGDPKSTKAQMDAAQQALADALANAEKAGSAVSDDVEKNLKDASGNVGKTEDQVGTGADQERARWGLDDASKNTSAALAGLRDAANKLAASKGQPKEGKGGKSGEFSGEMAMGEGAPGNTDHEATSVDATASVSNKERMALSLLQREKSSPEYSGMVQQYLKNLAAGEMPGE